MGESVDGDKVGVAEGNAVVGAELGAPVVISTGEKDGDTLGIVKVGRLLGLGEGDPQKI